MSINRRQLLTDALAGATALAVAKVVPAGTMDLSKLPPMPQKMRMVAQYAVTDDWLPARPDMVFIMRETRQWSPDSDTATMRWDIATRDDIGDIAQHYWMDEMPDHEPYLEELRKYARLKLGERLQTYYGSRPFTVVTTELLRLPNGTAHARYV